jgi:FIST C domain/FIST N domain
MFGAPAREIRHADVVGERDARLINDDPAPRATSAKAKSGHQQRAEIRGRLRVRSARARVNPQLASDDLSDVVVPDVEQVVPGGLARGGAGHLAEHTRISARGPPPGVRRPSIPPSSRAPKEEAGRPSAPDPMSGSWKVFSEKGVATEGFAMAGLCATSSATTLHGGFLGGYLPTAKRGVVTQAHGRVIAEIDGEPAAVVYNRWTGGIISQELHGGGNVLLKTNLHPLGRIIETKSGVPQRLLSHPHQVHPDGGLGLFTDISVGDVVELMIGTPEPLVSRTGKVVSRAVGRASGKLCGGVLVYCGGCLAAVLDRADDIATAFHAALEGAPFVGVATFGEQGCFLTGRNKLNRHGNLMCSSVLFGKQ